MEGRKMYYRFTLILLFVWFGAGGQTTVPDTNTFTLQNVVDIVVPTTNDLVDCHADALDYWFDPTYKGSKNNLLNFRNYKGTVTSSITFSESGSGSSLTYIGGRYVLTLNTPDGWDYIEANIYNGSMSLVATENVGNNGTLTNTLGTGYSVQYYVVEYPPTVYSDPIDQWFYHLCDGGSCPVNYTYMGLYHMVDAGTFTGATKEEANAARDAYGQAQADAATCECVYTGPPP